MYFYNRCYMVVFVFGVFETSDDPHDARNNLCHENSEIEKYTTNRTLEDTIDQTNGTSPNYSDYSKNIIEILLSKCKQDAGIVFLPKEVDISVSRLFDSIASQKSRHNLEVVESQKRHHQEEWSCDLEEKQ